MYFEVYVKASCQLNLEVKFYCTFVTNGKSTYKVDTCTSDVACWYIEFYCRNISQVSAGKAVRNSNLYITCPALLRTRSNIQRIVGSFTKPRKRTLVNFTGEAKKLSGLFAFSYIIVSFRLKDDITYTKEDDKATLMNNLISLYHGTN